MAKIIRNISFSQLGDLLQEEWEKGNITQDVHDSIEAGLLPIRLLRERLKWIIEREGEGVRLTVENDEIDNIINLRRTRLAANDDRVDEDSDICRAA
jgi:hypothetical protein